MALCDRLGFDLEDMLYTSAKSGIGVGEILPAVVKAMPPPCGDSSEGAELRVLIVDSWYDQFRGVISLVKVVDGVIRPGDKVCMKSMVAAKGGGKAKKFEVQEVGVLLPQQCPLQQLSAGQAGYIIAGMKSTSEAKVGDTMHDSKSAGTVQALAGFKEPQQMVFASIYPTDNQVRLRPADNQEGRRSRRLFSRVACGVACGVWCVVVCGIGVGVNGAVQQWRCGAGRRVVC
jgi:translation elongation factor EF-4